MKKITNLLVTSCLIGGFLVSCSEAEDSFFDQSAEARIQEQLQEYRDVLTSAENGWYAVYTPFQNGPEYKLWFSFNKNGRVTTWSDLPSGDYLHPLTKAGIFKNDESNYRVGLHQKPDLIFEDFMVLSNIAIQNSGSFEGEYEFNIIRANKDSVVLESSLELESDDQTELVLLAATAADKKKVEVSYASWEEQMQAFLDVYPEYTLSGTDDEYLSSIYIYAFVQNSVVLFMVPDFEKHGVYIGTLGQNATSKLYIPQNVVYRSLSGFSDQGWELHIPYPFSISSTISSEVHAINMNKLIPLVYTVSGSYSGYTILN